MITIEGYCLKYGNVPGISWASVRPAFMKDSQGKTLAMRSNIPVYIGYSLKDRSPVGHADIFLRKDGIWAKIKLPADLYSVDLLKDGKIGCTIKNVKWNNKEELVVDGNLFMVNLEISGETIGVHPVEKIIENRPFKEPIFWTRKE